MQLTDHFALEELLASETATARGFAEQFAPSPTSQSASDEDVYDNLKALAVNVLEPLRLKLNVPLRVSSGYRCPRLNVAVGGEPTSQHLCLHGSAAADITSPDMDVQDLYQAIKTANIPFDQLIIEHDSQWHLWVHVSFDSTLKEQRGQCMIGKKLDSGGTVCEADGFGSFKENPV